MTNSEEKPLIAMPRSKPGIRIVTVKGARYLQFRDINSCLVHLGSTCDPDAWRMASAALKEGYEMLALEDVKRLFPIAYEDLPAGTDISNVLFGGLSDLVHQKLIDKLNQAFDGHKKRLLEWYRAGFQFLNWDWHIEEVPNEIVDILNGREAEP